jgi:hypothetical protein
MPGKSRLAAHGAVVAGLLDRLGFVFKVVGPLTKLLSDVVSNRDPLQLAASISHRPKFACVHGKSLPFSRPNQTNMG